MPGKTPKNAPTPVPLTIGPKERFKSSLVGKEVRHLRSKNLALLRVAQVAQDFAHRKHPHGDRHDPDPVRQLVESEGETLDPRIDVGADDAE